MEVVTLIVDFYSIEGNPFIIRFKTLIDANLEVSGADVLKVIHL